MSPATIETMESTRTAAVRPVRRSWMQRVRRWWTAVFVDESGPERGYRARIICPIFLIFLSSSVHQAVTSGWSTTQTTAVITGLALFAAGFIAVVFRNTPFLHTDRAPGILAATVVIGAALVPALGNGWLVSLAIYSVSLILFNYDRPYWLPTLLIVPAVTWAVSSAAMGRSFAQGLGAAAQVLLIGTIQAAFYSQIRAKVALRQAQAELARLAVTEERLRIARDLHDILGQRLSAVSLKAEVAARLVVRDPDRAAAEMGEVASVARAALSDVRETVSGYRMICLNSEIETATTLLSAGSVTVRAVVEPLPRAIDECAGWLIREAVTNVIRHASASTCVIRTVNSGTSAVIEVSDDGRANAASAGPVFGNGLTGLSERVNNLGGHLSARRERGWFVVRASFDGLDPDAE